MSQYKLRFFYQTLGARPKATSNEIREIFLRMSKIYHPDNPKTGDQGKFVKIKDAYEQIKDAPLMKQRIKRPNIGITGNGGYIKLDGLYR